MKKGQVQCISDEILNKLSLKNRYKFLNYNLMSYLKPKHFDLLKETQKFFRNFEKSHDINHTEDFYEWIPEVGKAGFITRVHKFDNLGLDFETYGMTAEFMRVLA
ncbi:MAG: hypothetical protein MUP85_23545, partial [Candidatus Lokiarchaeota archaeon]|nr:hypothetical protein [Candidatus Lokiarchaeota archaeon]